MLNRQDSSVSSFRRQAASAISSPETNRSKAIGCMSGIIQLFSKYRNSNKRITFGRKHEKCKIIPTPSCLVKDNVTIILPAKEDKVENQVLDTERFLLCEVKVPTIEQEIQQLSSSESPRTPTPLVARLMGLEDYNVINSTVKNPPLIEEASNVEKRQQLLHALEKCNQDLEELKRILQRSRRLQLNYQVLANKCSDENVTNKCTDVRMVCDLDKFSHWPPICFSQLQTSAVKVRKHQCEPTAIKKVREEGGEIGNQPLFHKYSTTSTKQLLNMMNRRKAITTSPRRTNMAMIQCVEQVCSDLVWGQSREIKRIGLILQDCLWRNLVDELVKEMMKSCSRNFSLPLEGCKRRLCF